MSNYHNTEHDQATVSSPTDQYQTEKYPQQQSGSTGTGYNGERKSTGGGIFAKIGRNPLLTWGLRALQAISSIIALALASRSLSKFFNSERRMRFTSFVGSLSLLYLIILGLLSFFKPSLVMAGPVMVMEALLTILWLCAFIAIASRYSGFSCRRQSSSYGSSSGYGSGSGYGSSGSGYGSSGSGSGYNYITYPRYGGSSHVTGCRSSKAAIAFAAFSFLLFALGTALLFFNVFKRLMAHKRPAGEYFNPNSGIRLNKPAYAFMVQVMLNLVVMVIHTPYTNENNAANQGTGAGGYNSGNYNTSTGNEGYNYGNTGNTGNTGDGYYNQQQNIGSGGKAGSNVQYPETSHQRTY
ncbi:unnamed protein product [Wickerhamomyces anomalus]